MSNWFAIVGIVLGIGNVLIGKVNNNWKSAALGGFILAAALSHMVKP